MGRGSSGGEDHRLPGAIVLLPVCDLLGCGGGLTGSAPNVVGSDHRNCREGATTPPHRLRWGRARAGRDRRSLEFTITSLAADHAVAIPRKRTGRHFGPGPGRRSRPLDELAQPFGGDAAVAQTHLGRDGQRGLIGRSRCPTRRCTGRSPRASARSTKAHGGLGRQCIIDLPFRASPVNGRAFDRHDKPTIEELSSLFLRHAGACAHLPAVRIAPGLVLGHPRPSLLSGLGACLSVGALPLRGRHSLLHSR